ncbi:MAG: right-handed parallel beta-helix repeat-containing protein [Deltaproteobacteria bacterium]|nr:right-handed parallel beta-helix repeat-containing protein [Deltaproteobacteria bacterium]
MKNRLPIAFLIILFLLWSSVPLLAATINVPADFKTVQEAVNAASANDTIVVGEGTYRENIVVPKPLVIRSSKGPAHSVIHAFKIMAPVITIAADGVTVEGLSFTGSDVSGITLSRVKNSSIINNEATGNWIGITLRRSDGNRISDNTANLNKSYGIYMEYSNNNTVERNTANRNDDKGIFVSYSNGNTIKENTLNLNAWEGMLLWVSNNNTITDNRTLRNTFGMIISESSDNALSGNTSFPNIFLILPILLIYIGIISYLVQKNVLRFIYR